MRPISGAPVPVPDLGAAADPLGDFVLPRHRHYFSGRTERPHYRVRRHDFPGVVPVVPLARAFLDTCAADRSDDYRFLFTLLGGELANNAVRHSASGLPGGTYTLVVDRHRKGLYVTCTDRGPRLALVPAGTSDASTRPRSSSTRAIAPDPRAFSLREGVGRGLAVVEALATDWGARVRGRRRSVWLYLSYNLAGSRWTSEL
jgi:hypothetical protein